MAAEGPGAGEGPAHLRGSWITGTDFDEFLQRWYSPAEGYDPALDTETEDELYYIWWIYQPPDDRPALSDPFNRKKRTAAGKSKGIAPRSLQFRKRKDRDDSTTRLARGRRHLAVPVALGHRPRVSWPRIYLY